MQTMILLNDFQRQWDALREPVLSAVERVGCSGWLVLGTEVGNFESALAPWFGKAEAVGMGNCLDATEHALRSLDLRPGAKVLTTPLSAFATTLAVVRAGCVPVFLDTDASGQLDLDLVSDWLEHGGQRIDALLTVHLFGHPLDLVRLEKIQARFGIPVIEDCAQAIGASWNSAPVGSVGRISVTSFYPTKNLGAMGDGGAAMTDDPRLAAALRSLRDYGQSEKYRHDMLGSNSRLDELQAAILNDAFLPALTRCTERRREIAKAYREGIANPKIRLIHASEESASADHLFPIFVEAGKRAQFREYLLRADIQTAIHYPSLIPDQDALKLCPHEVPGSLANARTLSETEVSLPIHPYLEEEEVSRVIDACNGWH